MALMGTDANVPCSGYLTGHYSPRDLIFGAEGNAWTTSNGKGELKNDCYNNCSLPVPLSGQLSGYDKELLKQTMLKHEAIFRDQVCSISISVDLGFMISKLNLTLLLCYLS